MTIIKYPHIYFNWIFLSLTCLSAQEHALYPIHADGRWGYIDSTGAVVIPVSLKYDYVCEFHDGLARVNVGGKLYRRFRHYDYRRHEEIRGGKWGYINRAGALIVEVKYDHATDFHEGRAFVNTGGEWTFDYRVKDHIGVAPECEGGSWLMISITGNIVKAENTFSQVRDFHESRAWVRICKPSKNNYSDRDSCFWGGIDTAGQYIIFVQFRRVTDFNNHTAWVMVRERYGIIDLDGHYIIHPDSSGYKLLSDFSEGLAWAEKDTDRYIINHSGEILFRADYDLVRPFSDGVAWVRKNNRFFLIDRNGSIRCESPGPWMNDFREGYALVSDKNSQKCGFIDKSGKYVIKPVYDHGNDFDGGIAPVSQNGKWGCINSDGKIIIPFRFSKIEKFNGALARFEIEHRWGYINRRGDIVWEGK